MPTVRPKSGPGSQTSKYTEVRSFREIGEVMTNIIGIHQKNFIGRLWTELVYATPVCTRYAQASWFVSTGFPKTKNPNAPRPDTMDCKRLYPEPSLPDTIIKYGKADARKVSTWWLVNLAPYMQVLNTGTSKKATANYAGWINAIISKHVIEANNINRKS